MRGFEVEGGKLRRCHFVHDVSYVDRTWDQIPAFAMSDRRLIFLARCMNATADGPCFRPCRRLVPHNSYGIVPPSTKSDGVFVN
jgi:hypothetical protein